MKPTIEHLLDDLFEDAEPSGFRAAVLGKALRSARRRKQARHFSMALGVAAAVGVFVLSFWKMPGSATLTEQMHQPNPMIVLSQPLQPGQIVITRSDSVEEIASSTQTIAEIRTSGSSGLYQEIDDKQLMALLSDKPVALVRHGPHEAELILLNSGN